MLLTQHTFRASLDTSQAPATNSRRSRSHCKRRYCDCYFFSALHSSCLLASPCSVSRIRFILQSPILGQSLLPIRVPSILENMVSLRILLPGPPSSLRTTSRNTQIHFWLPSTWHYLPRGFRRICHGSSWLLSAFPRYQKYPSDLGDQLPVPTVPRLYPRLGTCISLKSLVRKHSFSWRI